MLSKVTIIDSCEVCGNKKLTSVLDLGLHPLCDDLVPFGDSRVCKEYPIEVLLCENCKTCHQRYQVTKSDLFPNNYHYRSRFTADVLAGMEELVNAIESRYGSLVEKTVLDIGSNDGSLLDFFKGKGAKTVGIEPTDAYIDSLANGHSIYNNFFSTDAAKKIISIHGQPDFITFTNVFAHIENLPTLLDAINELMAAETILIIENHYLGSVIEKNQFDTFYHEHPRTYSYTSFIHIAETLGKKLQHVEFPSRYGGNVRVFIGEKNTLPVSDSVDLIALVTNEMKFVDGFSKMRRNVEVWKEKKKKLINDLVIFSGPLKAKAFPGRCAILVKLLALDETMISSVYEKSGSLKIGHYLPGTRIPIVSDETILDGTSETTTMINMAWHIPMEIKYYLTGIGFTGNIVDIIEQTDFS